jgi:hypothetical protein
MTNVELIGRSTTVRVLRTSPHIVKPHSPTLKPSFPKSAAAPAWCEGEKLSAEIPALKKHFMEIGERPCLHYHFGRQAQIPMPVLPASVQYYLNNSAVVVLRGGLSKKS